jgi:hypothetical protein
MPGCRPRTAPSEASGSISFSLAVTIREHTKAARSPQRSEPANSHDFRPTATPRRVRFAALFDRRIRPSSRTRLKASRRFALNL